MFGAAPNGDMPAAGARRIDPLLQVLDNSGLLRLQSLSPAIDSSLGSFSEVTIDMDGEARSGPKDVGADEFSDVAASPRSLTPTYVGPNAP